jgi:hypothetical protein
MAVADAVHPACSRWTVHLHRRALRKSNIVRSSACDNILTYTNRNRTVVPGETAERDISLSTDETAQSEIGSTFPSACGCPRCLALFQFRSMSPHPHAPVSSPPSTVNSRLHPHLHCPRTTEHHMQAFLHTLCFISQGGTSRRLTSGPEFAVGGKRTETGDLSRIQWLRLSCVLWCGDILTSARLISSSFNDVRTVQLTRTGDCQDEFDGGVF